MSIEELFSFMREELKGCSGYAFIDKALADLYREMSNRPNFQPEKFKQWFLEKNVIYKNSPLAFLTKCGMQDLESGAFDKQVITGFDMLPLCDDFRARGITFTGDDTCYIDTYLVYIYNNGLMSLEEISEWLKNAVDYVEKHSKNATEFKTLFKKSITIKRLRLPYKELDDQIEKDNADFNEAMETLEKMKAQNRAELEDGNPQESETIYEKENN